MRPEFTRHRRVCIRDLEYVFAFCHVVIIFMHEGFKVVGVQVWNLVKMETLKIGTHANAPTRQWHVLELLCPSPLKHRW
jgi:hypothetical protein